MPAPPALDYCPKLMANYHGGLKGQATLECFSCVAVFLQVKNQCLIHA